MLLTNNTEIALPVTPEFVAKILEQTGKFSLNLDLNSDGIKHKYIFDWSTHEISTGNGFDMAAM